MQDPEAPPALKGDVQHGAEPESSCKITLVEKLQVARPELLAQQPEVVLWGDGLCWAGWC